jgi:DNA-binding NarL/FixJ family response regulator
LAPRSQPYSALASRLTRAERRIVRRVLTGRTNREIANDLRVTEQFVKNALTVIYDKCGVRNRLELALAIARRRRAKARR